MALGMLLLDLQATTTQRADTPTCIELYLTNPDRSVANGNVARIATPKILISCCIFRIIVINDK